MRRYANTQVPGTVLYRVVIVSKHMYDMDNKAMSNKEGQKVEKANGIKAQLFVYYYVLCAIDGSLVDSI